LGKSTPSPPPAPDYTGAANAQGAANLTASKQGAVLSNPNVNGPLGNQQVSYDNITGPDGQSYLQPTINQNLSPDAQATINAQQGVQLGLANLGKQALGTAGSYLGQQFNPQNVGLQTSINAPQMPDISGMGQAQGGPSSGQYGLAHGNVSDPNFQTSLNTSGVANLPVNAGVTGQQAIMNRLQPQIDQRDSALRQQLANQGLTAGGEAYTNSMRDQNNANNDLYSQAALSGLNLDMQNNQLGMTNAINSGNFANNAQQGQFNAGLQNAGLYNQSIAQNFGQGQSAAQMQNSALAQNQNAALSHQGQAYNQALQSGQFGNQAALQNYQQQLAQYNQPLNQISALMSGSQVQLPQFQGYSGQNVTPAPIANATTQLGQYNQNIYGQQVAASNAQSQGIGSILGAGASLLAAPATGGASLFSSFLGR